MTKANLYQIVLSVMQNCHTKPWYQVNWTNTAKKRRRISRRPKIYFQRILSHGK